MMLNLGLIYVNLLWLGRAGSLHLPPMVLTPGMIGQFMDSVYEIYENLEVIFFLSVETLYYHTRTSDATTSTIKFFGRDSVVSFKELLLKFTQKVATN